jgi:trans-aconitate 2-methyltransferase
MGEDLWNPSQYERFGRERRQPFDDLLALVRPHLGMRVVDLGCGTGETTRDLHRRLGSRETIGLDSSPAMLDKAAAHAGDGLRFQRGDIATWVPQGPFDLVFSNAALHWVDGHETLFARLADALGPEGQLAVQMPANHDQATHRVAMEVAMQSPFRDALPGGARQVPLLAPEAYAALLHRLDFRHQHVRLQVYPHVLASREDVLEWVKGTTLTWYQSRLPADLYVEFEQRYHGRLLAALPDQRPFFFPFKRIHIWAER